MHGNLSPGQDPTGFCLFSPGFLSYTPPLTGSMDVGLSPISPVSLAQDILSCIFCKTAVRVDNSQCQPIEEGEGDRADDCCKIVVPTRHPSLSANYFACKSIDNR